MYCKKAALSKAHLRLHVKSLILLIQGAQCNRFYALGYTQVTAHKEGKSPLYIYIYTRHIDIYIEHVTCNLHNIYIVRESVCFYM